MSNKRHRRDRQCIGGQVQYIIEEKFFLILYLVGNSDFNNFLRSAIIMQIYLIEHCCGCGLTCLLIGTSVQYVQPTTDTDIHKEKK